MAGLLAWAADVVGGSGQNDDGGEDDLRRIPVVFTAEQQQYALQLDQKAADLRRSIRDLRLRTPPPHISQRLPHLHAHTVASNAALSLQLDAHSTTREQAQLREVTLQEENAAYEKAISSCEKKIQEKLHEADLFQTKLKELDMTEKNSKAELEKALAAAEFSQARMQADESQNVENSRSGTEPSNHVTREVFEEKKRELSSIEETVQRLEKDWSLVQEDAVKQPSPAQREKLLEKQLHSLVEQLTAKQAQAEDLMREIHTKEREVERLNELRRRLDSGSTDMGIAARNRFGRNNASSAVGTAADYYGEMGNQRYGLHSGGRTESQHRLMLLRSAFIIYILALHVIVFIKISFSGLHP